MKFIKKEWGEASYRKLHLQKGLGIMGMVLAFLFAENNRIKRGIKRI